MIWNDIRMKYASKQKDEWNDRLNRWWFYLHSRVQCASTQKKQTEWRQAADAQRIKFDPHLELLLVVAVLHKLNSTEFEHVYDEKRNQNKLKYNGNSSNRDEWKISKRMNEMEMYKMDLFPVRPLGGMRKHQERIWWSRKNHTHFDSNACKNKIKNTWQASAR